MGLIRPASRRSPMRSSADGADASPGIRAQAVAGNSVSRQPPAYLTPDGMQELMEWTRQVIREQTHHPLLIIASFLVQFLQVDPFQDGNGRLSRILTNLLMLQADYPYIPLSLMKS